MKLYYNRPGNPIPTIKATEVVRGTCKNINQDCSKVEQSFEARLGGWGPWSGGNSLIGACCPARWYPMVKCYVCRFVEAGWEKGLKGVGKAPAHGYLLTTRDNDTCLNYGPCILPLCQYCCECQGTKFIVWSFGVKVSAIWMRGSGFSLRSGLEGGILGLQGLEESRVKKYCCADNKVPYSSYAIASLLQRHELLKPEQQTCT